MYEMFIMNSISNVFVNTTHCSKTPYCSLEVIIFYNFFVALRMCSLLKLTVTNKSILNILRALSITIMLSPKKRHLCHHL